MLIHSYDDSVLNHRIQTINTCLEQKSLFAKKHEGWFCILLKLNGCDCI